MAMSAIETASLATKFSARAEMEIQQADSRTAPSTQVEAGVVGTNGMQLVHRVQAINPRTITDLITVRTTTIDSMNSDSRFLPAPTLYEINRAYNTESLLLRLIDEKSSERESIVAGFMRKKDIIFIDASVGNAPTSMSYSSSAFTIPTAQVGLPATNVVTCTSTDTATTACTKLIDKVAATALDWTTEQKILYIPSKFVSMLFRDAQYVNAPYLETETLAKGSMKKTILGIQFIPLDDSGIWSKVNMYQTYGTNAAVFCVGKPVAVGMWKDFAAEILQDASHDFAWILHCSMSMSAVRLWEEKVYILDLSAVVL